MSTTQTSGGGALGEEPALHDDGARDDAPPEDAPHDDAPQVDAPQVVLAEITASPLSVDAVLEAVRHPRAGGIATFIGVVRERDHGVHVVALDYTFHPSAPEVLRDLAARLAAAGDVIRVAVVHRVGHLEIGDLAVVVAVSAEHRASALEMCRRLIDATKAGVPIWKHQLFEDGSDEWVGTS